MAPEAASADDTMRHRIHHRKLNRTSEHRKALLRSLAQSLVEHGRITTTLPKAKTIRPYVERLVTLAVRARKLRADGDMAGALRARRSIHRLLGDRSLVPAAHRDTYASMSDAARKKTMRMGSGRRYRTGEAKGRLAFTGESVTHRLIEGVAPRFEDRPGGYTRIIQLGKRRLGDASPLAMVQWVGDEEVPTALAKPARSARRRRTDARYAMAIKLAKLRGQSPSAVAPKADAPDKSTSGQDTAGSGEAEGSSNDS